MKPEQLLVNLEKLNRVRQELLQAISDLERLMDVDHLEPARDSIEDAMLMIVEDYFAEG